MKRIIATAAAFAPILAFAQTAPVTDVNSLSLKLQDIGNLVIYILIALAVIFVVWNVVMTLIKAGNQEEKAGHMKNIGWGILGLAIVLSIWGLVAILTNTFRTTPTTAPIPNLNPNPAQGGIPSGRPIVQ